MKHGMMRIAYHCTVIVLRLTIKFKTDSSVLVHKSQARIKKHITNQAKCGNHSVRQSHDARLPRKVAGCLFLYN